MAEGTRHGAKSESGIKLFGLVWLVPGVTNLHVVSLMWAALVSIGLLTIISIATNYILTTNFKDIVAVGDYGKINGDLTFWTEVTLILLFSAVGVMADRIGRRPVFAFGLMGMGLGYLFYPLAGSLGELTVYRVIYAVGLAATTGMLGTVVQDYPQEKSRGKMIAIFGLLNGLGVILMNVLFRYLLNLAEGWGFDETGAGKFALWVIVSICFVSAGVVGLGLKPGTPVRHEDRSDLRTLIRAGFLQAKNPRIALAYSSAFVARSDLVILGTFSVTWGTVAGVSQGLSGMESARAALLIFITAQTAALFWVPVAGFIMDRLNRVTGAAILLAFAAIGYTATIFVDNPLDPSAMKFFVLLGIGQMSAFFAATVLIGQEAPVAERGSVVGMFNVVGAIGILISTVIGGRLFDAVAPSAPFVMIGIFNSIICLAAIVVRIKSPGPIPDNLGNRLSVLKARFKADET